jgi:type II secretory pathway pseudopilin PulG
VISTKQLRVNNGIQRSLPILVFVFVGLSVLLTLAFAGWREWVAREAQVREIQTSLANLASALTQHAEDTIEGADTVLAGLVERVAPGETMGG